jgi:hypothetical protein
MTSQTARPWFQLGSIDLLLVDGSHEYLDVLADLLGWRPLLAPGGTLIVDDWRHPPVSQAIGDSIPPDWARREVGKMLWLLG